MNILPQNGRQCLVNIQIAVYQRHLSEILKISKRQTFMSCVLQTICQGFQDLSAILGPVFAALFEFDDIGADQPVAPVQHLADGQSGPGLGGGVDLADGVGKMVEVHGVSSGWFSASRAA